MTRSIKSLSVLLVVLYLILSSMAPHCAASHDIHHSPIHHHSKGKTSHSSLCSWACQVSSKANAADMGQQAFLTLIIVVAGVVILLAAIPPATILSSTLARGPPV